MGGGGGGGGGRGKVQNIGGPRGPNISLAGKLTRVPVPNQCQIITFLTWITDDIAKLRIELKSILEISSNKIKGKSIKLVHL